MKKTFIAILPFVALMAIVFACQDESATSWQRKQTAPTEATTMVTTATPSAASVLDALPKDTGGKHTAVKLGSNASPYGYYIYTPSAYTATGPKFPLLIFLHGSGEIGNSSTDVKVLDKILVNGPPKLIKAGQWHPKYPMVVASAQCHESWWDRDKLKKFTEFIMATYRVDTVRIYMTGLSMGGYGTWDQLTKFGGKAHITAAVPISGGGAMNPIWTKRASQFPIWAFHGEADHTVLPDYDKQMWSGINALNPNVRMKLTMYAGVGHDAWTRTYSGSGINTGEAGYDQFNMDIYSWMFQYAKK